MCAGGNLYCMQTPSFPIASIVFEGDYRLAVLQALSIDRLFDLDGLAEYTIVCNGEDNVNLRRSFEADVRPVVSNKLWGKVRIIEWKDLLGDAEKVGYYDQQALKLSLGDYYDTEFFLMLDSKNHFIRPTAAEDFFHDGKPYGPMTNTSDMWRPYLEKSFAAMDNDHADLRQMMPSITPYLMYSAEVKKVADLLTNKTGLALPQAMKSTGGTEFLMYYASIQPHLGNLYWDMPLSVKTLFATWPQDPQTVLNAVADATTKGIHMFGLHRKRIPQLTEEQTEAIIKMWRAHLLASWEDPNWFLHH